MLASRVDELRQLVRLTLPGTLAERTGASYTEIGPDRGELRLALWGAPIQISYPNLTAVSQNDDILPDYLQALLLYYLHTADGAPLTGKWVSFADLPGGRMYNQAFQGYSGDELVKTFGLDVHAFAESCQRAGGQAQSVGDASFAFSALPLVPVMVTYWLGDEDFPSSCKILFDASATHYLPIDVCAILGSMLASRIKRA